MTTIAPPLTLDIQSTTETLSSANSILSEHNALLNRVAQSQASRRRQIQSLWSPPQSLLALSPISPHPQTPSSDGEEDSADSEEDEIVKDRKRKLDERVQRTDLPPAKRARVQRYTNYVPEEETIRNNYSANYVESGEWPQNYVLGAEPERRFEEYPKQQRLLALKKTSVNQYALSPFFYPFSKLQQLATSGTKFDVILLDPPYSSSFNFDRVAALPVPQLAADPSFVFLWVGSGAGEGLERGREILAKWGYRRCEDVVWVKTNHDAPKKGPGCDPPTTTLFTRTKLHCLIGIRGTVRRSTDAWFVHCNVDTDVIVAEEDPSDPTRKPEEMYTLIENFCLGMKRLELFGRRGEGRRGWVSVVPDNESGDGNLGGPVWQREPWEQSIKELSGGASRAVVPMTAEIDALRPKSPVRNQSQIHSSHAPPSMPNNPNLPPVPQFSAPMRFPGNAPRQPQQAPRHLPQHPQQQMMMMNMMQNMGNMGPVGPLGMQGMPMNPELMMQNMGMQGPMHGMPGPMHGIQGMQGMPPPGMGMGMGMNMQPQMAQMGGMPGMQGMNQIPPPMQGMPPGMMNMNPQMLAQMGQGMPPFAMDPSLHGQGGVFNPGMGRGW